MMAFRLWLGHKYLIWLFLELPGGGGFTVGREGMLAWLHFCLQIQNTYFFSETLKIFFI